MTLITEHCFAYVNHGRWVAECPRPFCGNAFKLQANETIFQCIGGDGCGMVASIEWPVNANEIWEALLQRPVPSTRNWYPIGHPMVERFGYPGDQTPAELLEEQRKMEGLQ